jgi:hypothetical protein
VGDRRDWSPDPLSHLARGPAPAAHGCRPGGRRGRSTAESRRRVRHRRSGVAVSAALSTPGPLRCARSFFGHRPVETGARSDDGEEQPGLSDRYGEFVPVHLGVYGHQRRRRIRDRRRRSAPVAAGLFRSPAARAAREDLLRFLPVPLPDPIFSGTVTRYAVARDPDGHAIRSHLRGGKHLVPMSRIASLAIAIAIAIEGSEVRATTAGPACPGRTR